MPPREDLEWYERQIRLEEKEIKRLAKEVLKTRRVLARRTRTLDRLLHLKMLSLNLLAPDYILNPKDFEARRGRRSKPIPIREAMHILGVSHRTAQDYVRVLKALEIIDEWFERKTRLLLMLRALAKARIKTDREVKV